MTIYNFTHYVHDDLGGYELIERVLPQIKAANPDFDMDEEELMEALGKPFYEVALDCQVEFTEVNGHPQGNVTILGAHL